MSLRLPWLGDDPASGFPPLAQALREPDGLLAAGGDLQPVRLLDAYARGIFPWFSAGDPILWWSPDPRMVFRTDGVRLPSKFRRQLRRRPWTVRADTCFDRVIAACAHTPRDGQRGTWIDADMQVAYGALHALGHAHSVEVFDDDDGRLIGGLYGVAVGRMFYGESMYSAVSGASKVALAMLARVLRGWDWPLIDAQVENPHLLALGAERMPRADFAAAIAPLVAAKAAPGPWTQRFGRHPVAELADPEGH